MRVVSRAKGVADMRTAISTHYRTNSRHEGTPYLETLALGMEKLRLRKELAVLGKREERIRKRLVEIKTLIESTVSQVQDNAPPVPKAPGPGEQQAPAGGPWRRMTVGY